jgi:methyl-accepting chemotaxis protein WspA
MTIRNLGVKKGLFLLFSVFALVFSAFAFVTWQTIETVRVNGPVYGAIVEGKDLVADILPPPAYIIETHLLSLQLADQTDALEQAALIKRGNALRVEFDNSSALWKRKLPPGKLADAMIVTAYRPALEYYGVRDNELVPAVRAGDAERTKAALLQLKRLYEEHRRAIDGVVTLTNKRNAELELSAGQSVRNGHRNLLLLGGLVVAVVGYLAWLASRMASSLTSRISLAAGIASRVANGDLTVNMPKTRRTDESGRLLSAIQAMTTSLHSVVARVKQASSTLTAATAEFRVAGNQQEQWIVGLRDSAAQIAGAAHKISVTSSDLMSTTEGVNAVASQTALVAEAGLSSLGDMNGAMHSLQQAADSISTRLDTIREKASNIGGVVTTITRISELTSTLSVNAAIEAEKEGGQVIGFLVLAREISRLADQTATATHDIDRMVLQMQSAVAAAVHEMESFAGEVAQSAGVSIQVGTQLSQIMSKVKMLSERFDQVNRGMRSQSRGANQINDGMARLLVSANASAEALPGFKAAIARQHTAATSLTQEISRFKLAA